MKTSEDDASSEAAPSTRLAEYQLGAVRRQAEDGDAVRHDSHRSDGIVASRDRSRCLTRAEPCKIQP